LFIFFHLSLGKFYEQELTTLTLPLLCDYTSGTYTVDQLRTMESTVLNTLEWNVNFDTLLTFVLPLLHIQSLPQQCKGNERMICSVISALCEEAMLLLPLFDQYSMFHLATAIAYNVQQLVVTTSTASTEANEQQDQVQKAKNSITSLIADDEFNTTIIPLATHLLVAALSASFNNNGNTSTTNPSGQ